MQGALSDAQRFAYLIKRSPDVLRHQYLYEMVKSTQIQLAFPSKPTHGGQPYKAYVGGQDEAVKLFACGSVNPCAAAYLPMMSGGGPLTLRRLLGHASLVMTMEYAHFSSGHLNEEGVESVGYCSIAMKGPDGASKRLSVVADTYHFCD